MEQIKKSLKIVFSSNVSWSIYNFRMQLLKTLQSAGHEIYVIAKKDKYSSLLEKEGFNYYEIDIENNAKNPFLDLLLIKNYIKIYKQINPDIILHNAIKPNIYGTIAAGYLKIKTINNISGLGTIFIKKSVSTIIAKNLYRFSQKFATKVFFQNPEDKHLFNSKGLVSASKSDLLPGSGVDTSFLSPEKFIKQHSENFRFLFIGRLIKDKGIIEFIEAANSILIKQEDHNVLFKILGPLYEQNETGVTKKELDQWLLNEKIVYLGETDDVGSELAKCDCLVLPSYREGLSKVLIEASSMAVPIVTTNVPGCKDVVKDGVNGFLCKSKDAKSLELAMIKMLKLSNSELVKMGNKGREIAIHNYDVKIVIGKYIDAINQIINIEQHVS